jgi:Uma2 family endonuclease
MAVAETEQLRPYTYADLLAMPEDTVRREIIDGELIVSPSPNRWHQELVALVYDVLKTAGAAVGKVWFAPLDVRLSDHDSVQPDVLFVRTERFHILAEDGRITGAPDIVVEIVSSTSARYDRVRKFALFARAGVPEYWILDYRDRSFAIDELRDGRYHAVPADADGRLRSRVLPNLAVAAEELFAGIPPSP